MAESKIQSNAIHRKIEEKNFRKKAFLAFQFQGQSPRPNRHWLQALGVKIPFVSEKIPVSNIVATGCSGSSYLHLAITNSLQAMRQGAAVYWLDSKNSMAQDILYEAAEKFCRNHLFFFKSEPECRDISMASVYDQQGVFFQEFPKIENHPNESNSLQSQLLQEADRNRLLLQLLQDIDRDCTPKMTDMNHPVMIVITHLDVYRLSDEMKSLICKMSDAGFNFHICDMGGHPPQAFDWLHDHAFTHIIHMTHDSSFERIKPGDVCLVRPGNNSRVVKLTGSSITGKCYADR